MSSAVACLLSAGCEKPEDICAPVTDRIGFFSQGDCIFTRARFFRGHEWVTYFGNRELDASERFDESEVHWMALGNRRVDYPMELLVHLDNGILSYVDALMDRTERAEEQPHHFLLGGNDTEAEAAEAGRAHILDVTERALRLWSDDRVRALTLLGQAQHTVQDSFSPAHTIRRTDDAAYGVLPSEGDTCSGECGCILRVKAYLRRDADFREGVLYHGTDEDTIGHITNDDSIYRSGRNCHRPVSPGAVSRCLNPHAKQAAFATMTYLAWVRAEIERGNAGTAVTADSLRPGFDELARAHLAACEP